MQCLDLWLDSGTFPYLVNESKCLVIKLVKSKCIFSNNGFCHSLVLYFKERLMTRRRKLTLAIGWKQGVLCSEGFPGLPHSKLTHAVHAVSTQNGGGDHSIND